MGLVTGGSYRATQDALSILELVYGRFSDVLHHHLLERISTGSSNGNPFPGAEDFVLFSKSARNIREAVQQDDGSPPETTKSARNMSARNKMGELSVTYFASTGICTSMKIRSKDHRARPSPLVLRS